MITIFNRRELFVTVSLEKQMEIRQRQGGRGTGPPRDWPVKQSNHWEQLCIPSLEPAGGGSFFAEKGWCNLGRICYTN